MNNLTIAAETIVDAPAAETWAVLADYARDVQWRTGVRRMTPTPEGPVRAGTTTHEVLRTAGRTTRNDGLVTEVVAGRRFAWRTTAGVDADGTREVVPLGGDACRVRLTLRVRPPGVLRLVPGPLRWMLARTLRSDLARLRVLVEPGGTDPEQTDGADLTGSGFTGPEGRDDRRDGPGLLGLLR
ncbi:SRPBCC family protein [Pseudonocardia sp. ICBG601]|uniref:SRPBCC family protein n=1 Tax=Pseudonocardia sp. ICBG601 TaxID=2846759 RepID=UPI001CF6760A|nr:SRPBCC family protein [Pseudonocardia sp. ICBG601]